MRRTSHWVRISFLSVLGLAAAHAARASSGVWIKPAGVSGTTFDLNGHDQQVAALSGLGTITNSSGTPATFTLSTNATLAAQNLITGNLSFTFTGGGKLTLQTPATYTGGTTIDNATLISGLAPFGTDALPATSSLTLANNATFDLNGHQQDLTAIFGTSGTVTNSATGFAADLVLSPFTTSTLVTPITGNLNLNKENNTLLFIAATPTYTGLTSIDAGTLFFNTNASVHKIDGIGNLTIGAGFSLTSDTVQLPTVHIIAGGTHTIRPNGSDANASFVNTLTLDGKMDAWTSTFDLTNNKLDLVPQSDRATALANVRNQVLFGKTHTAGFHATGLPDNETLAVIDNALAGKTKFAGLTVNANSILIGPELLGDANLDGLVNIADLNTLAANWQQPVSDWTLGDFNGDGVVNIVDLNFLAANWQAGVGGGAGNGESFAQALAAVGLAGAESVPEPSSLAILALASVSLLRRRRG